MSSFIVYLSPSTIYAFVGILLFLNFFVYSPIVSYYCVQFWKLRNESFFNKRHPYFVLALVITAQIWTCISRAIQMILLVSEDQTSLLFSFNTLFLNLGYCIFGMTIIRFWWLYFDYTRALQLKALKWQRNIAQDLNLPWTLKYKYLGDRKFLSTLVILFTIISNISIQLFIFLKKRMKNIRFKQRDTTLHTILK